MDTVLDWAVKIGLFGFAAFLLISCVASVVGCSMGLNECPSIEYNAR
jgi:O-antigen ligase